MQAQKELTHNEALVRLDMLAHAAVETGPLDQPPADPQPGQCWLVGSAPEREWQDAPGALACWTENGWRLSPGIDGMAAWVIDRQLWAVRTGGAWRIGEGRFASLSIAGQQVLGPRQPAVPVPSGGAVIDAEARAAIAVIVARMVAHGLVD
ncbi:DUF2793 domain-containing protein [Sphingomonas changnyeongensis]|uniref:DUF2793 domain-containing protein n=1 Tax=Sphingomonas changnyeongensis TaxID=2698679 RepID=A0A7Z2NWN6_9SPHN|nr:DUF2793 domain-containing protein [Sphingomonas changnyeongensis]QHL90715.1 DUF2793 domain-containing protein [Sphingomonas changnyeongensis]